MKFSTIFLAWWLLPVHLILSLILAIVLTQSLQGRFVNIANTGHVYHGGRLSQPDVSALVSAALTVIRTLAGAATSLIGWQMAFHALAKSRTTLTQLERMISWRRPALRGQGLLWIVFLLSVPTQFSAPVLQGAINWIPDTLPVAGQSQAITTPGPTTPWNWHNYYDNNRFHEVMTAAGLYPILSTADNYVRVTNADSVRDIPSRRVISSLFGQTVGSTVDNVTLPYLRVHSIKWAKTENDVEQDMDLLDPVISEDILDTQTFSGWSVGGLEYNLVTNLFRRDTDDGRFVPVNTKVWQPAQIIENNPILPIYQWPQPTTHHETVWIVMVTEFTSECNPPPGWLGDLKELYFYFKYTGTASCFIFAQVTYTAGVITCRDCKIVSDGVVEASADMTSQEDIQPHPLVEDAIAMIPEVLFYVKITNTSRIPVWDNVNGYISGVLSTTYQASWNSMANRFGEYEGAPVEYTTLRSVVSVLRAQVNSIRIWIWFTLNALLTASGVSLLVLQSSSGTDLVKDPAITALLVDPDSLCDHVTSQSRDATDIYKAGSALKIKSKKMHDGRTRLLVDHIDRTEQTVLPNMYLLREEPKQKSMSFNVTQVSSGSRW